MQEYSRAGRGSGLDGGLCAGPEAWLARCEQHPLMCMGHKDLRESGPSLPLSPLVHLEPDILECEAMWALGSTTMNKAGGTDGIPVELFQILKDDAVKVLHSIYWQIWKT